MSAKQDLFIGVDVGTGSARAALTDAEGNSAQRAQFFPDHLSRARTVLAESSYATTTWRDDRDAAIFEQSTTEIWSCISKACHDVLRDAQASKEQVKGIGFDATCSLGVCRTDGTPQSVTIDDYGTGEDKRNIILWADHRAEAEANLINSTDSSVLKYVGGTMSLEMELPKILWLKKRMPAEAFGQCMFFDLPDYLTYLATQDTARSNCSIACKCSYVPPDVEDGEGWNPALMKKIGLESFVANDFEQLGGQPGGKNLILTAGQNIGKGLSKKAAGQLGLLEGTAVGSGLIDAYAGWVGTVAAPMEGAPKSDLTEAAHRLCAIAGTSTCHIVQSQGPVFVPGVWGPYKNAVFCGYWMNEGGQSSTGQLMDFVINTHPAAAKLMQAAKDKGINHFVLLGQLLAEMQKAQSVPSLPYLTKDLFVYPDLHGNRSPLADPHMKGMLTGWALDATMGDLALRYLATCEAIALQTRQILDSMNERGHKITSIFMSGGLVKNPILMQLLANICNVPVQLPFSHSASVVLGSAMLGAMAAEEAKAGPIKDQADAEKRAQAMKDRLWELMVRMSKPGSTVKPNASAAEKKLLDVKYSIFRESIDIQRRWRKDIAGALK